MERASRLQPTGYGLQATGYGLPRVSLSLSLSLSLSSLKPEA
jgi:hypothetical protein